MLISKAIFLVAIAIVAPVLAESRDPAADTSTLKSVQVVFRHGKKVRDIIIKDRTGLLNDEGKLEMFEVGEYTRHRYGDFIDLNYDSAEVQIITSGAKRCTQSGTMFAYGLYQNFSRAAKWNPKDPYAFEPIPVDPIPSQIDKWLQLSAPCPKKKYLDDNSLAEAAMQNLKDHSDFYGLYAQEIGDLDMFKNVTMEDTLQTIFPAISIFDPSVPKPPGDWYIPWLAGENLYYEFKFNYLDLFYNSSDLRQLATGPFFEMLYNRTELNRNPSKLYAYATHDFSITALTVLFGQNLRDFAPDHPTGTTYFLEVHQAPNDTSAEAYLQVFYRNSTIAPIREFQVRECGSPCYVSKFKTLVQKWVPQDYEKLCILETDGADGVSQEASFIFWVIVISGSVVVFGCILFVIFKKCRKQRNYQQV